MDVPNEKSRDQHLYPVIKGGKTGLIDSQGHLVVDFKLDGVGEFENGMASFSLADKHGFIHADGHILIEPKFDGIGFEFVDGLCEVLVDDKWGYINIAGEICIAPRFEHAGEFSEERADITLDGKDHYIDTSGNIVIEHTLGFTHYFRFGRKHIEINGMYGYMDRWGNVVIKPQYRQASTLFRDGVASVAAGSYMGVIDVHGEYVAELRYFAIFDFNEGLAFYKEELDGLCGVIRSDGSIAFEPSVPEGTRFSEGLASIEFGNGKYGLVDVSGNIVVKPRFEFLSHMVSSRARFGKSGKEGFIDREGNVIVAPEYTLVQDFRGNLAKVMKDEKVGYVDKDGAVVWRPSC